jgi:glycine oxidase ThiO
MHMQAHRDVSIVGGGAIGLATAIELALQGVSINVFSRNFQEAALHAAAGMLAPQAEGIAPGPMLDLCLRSRAMYPEWMSKLESLTGMDAEYWPCGILAPQYDPSSSKEWCDRPSLDALQLGLGEDVMGGWWFPQDGQVNNQKLAQVLRVAAQQLGVQLLEGVTVEQITHTETQVTGVQTTAGIYTSDRYVLATGAWSGGLLSIPVVPRKGQMLAVRAGVSPQPLRHVLFGSEIYIVPRRNGRIVIGATSENVGFAPQNTPAGIQQLLTDATRLYPPLKDWVLEQCWWGFRPTTPDELPILGPSPYENLVLATGHHRNGILLTPITATLLADLICFQKIDPLLPTFSCDRFAAT